MEVGKAWFADPAQGSRDHSFAKGERRSGDNVAQGSDRRKAKAPAMGSCLINHIDRARKVITRIRRGKKAAVSLSGSDLPRAQSWLPSVSDI